MSEFLSPHARSVLLSDRRCTATNRNGERCGRASALGQFVCDRHGAKSPLAQKEARERLQEMVEPALGVLHRAMRDAPPCPHCGRSDADRDPSAIRAAQIVLDRSGFHPTLTVEQVAPPNPFADLDDDGIVEKLEELLAAAKARRDLHLAHAPALLGEGFIVPDDEPADDATPIQTDDVRIPTGNDAADPGISDKTLHESELPQDD